MIIKEHYGVVSNNQTDTISAYRANIIVSKRLKTSPIPIPIPERVYFIELSISVAYIADKLLE